MVKFFNEKRAFTMAELLLTLVILGVIAAVALPGLRKNVSNKQYEGMMSKNYLNFKSAWEMVVSENKGYMENIYTNNAEFLRALQRKGLIANNCDSSKMKCFSWAVKGKAPVGFDKFDLATSTKIVLEDGTFGAVSFDPACSLSIGNYSQACGFLLIDANGSAVPNVYSKDVYGFIYTRETVVPADDSYIIK